MVPQADLAHVGAAVAEVNGVLNPWTSPWRRACAAALMALAAALPAAAGAQEDAAALERRVKGALLHRFLAYVEWPAAAFAAADSPLVIGVLGNDILASELQTFTAGRTAQKRPVAVRRLGPKESPKDVHVLFIGRAEAGQLERIARTKAPTLIVAEWPGALEDGAAINFVIINDHVRFDISLEAARQRNLNLSSRLLSVANEVKTAAP
jgi:hypothetical protein